MPSGGAGEVVVVAADVVVVGASTASTKIVFEEIEEAEIVKTPSVRPAI